MRKNTVIFGGFAIRRYLGYWHVYETAGKWREIGMHSHVDSAVAQIVYISEHILYDIFGAINAEGRS